MTISINIRTAPDEVDAVLALVSAVADADGVSPVSEHVLLYLRHGGDRQAYSLLAHRDDAGPGQPELVGYAYLETADPAHGASAELAVHPAYRRHGVGGALLDELEQISDRGDAEGRLWIWAHGQHPGATALARRRGYLAERELWQMRRSLDDPVPEPTVPPGIRIRPFRVGQDEAAWTEVNNRAFASHPDQGGWDVAEVRVREREPWFDPDGFLVAERVTDGAIVGFHWTKVHAAEPAEGGGGGTAGEPIGEVYVVGVDPAAQGMGLGRVLTLAGLRYLRSAGLSQVMLYVDESNAPAVAVYSRLGFIPWRTDVQYRRP